MEDTPADETEKESENSATNFAVCSNGHCGNGSGKKRESVDRRKDGAAWEGGVKHAEEEPEDVTPGNKRALSQDENDRRQ